MGTRVGVKLQGTKEHMVSDAHLGVGLEVLETLMKETDAIAYFTGSTSDKKVI